MKQNKHKWQRKYNNGIFALKVCLSIVISLPDREGLQNQFDGFVQGYGNSSALAIELRQSCTRQLNSPRPAIFFFIISLLSKQ